MKKLFLIIMCFLSLKSFALEKPSFSSTHKLIFFFASTCPYCHAFAPILKEVSKELGLKVVAYSFDNKPLPHFTKFYEVNAELSSAAFDEAISYPALFIINKQTKILYPVSTGALSKEELIGRLLALIPKIIHYEEAL